MLESWRAKRGVQHLIDSWTEYHTFVSDALRTEQVTWDKEEPFLALKGKIATRLQLLEIAAPPELTAEARREIGEITELLKGHVNLRERAPGEDWDADEFDRVWHGHFIFLNRLKGMPIRLPEKPKTDKPKPPKAEKAPTVSTPSPVPPPRPARVPTGVRLDRAPFRLGYAKPIRFVVGLGLFSMIVYMVSAGLGIHRSPETGNLTAAVPETFELALINVLEALQSLWSAMVTKVLPWVGSVWPIILALAVVVWGFTWLVGRRVVAGSVR